MKLKYKLLLVLLVGLLGYGIGRYLQPAKIKIKKETKVVKVEVEKEKIRYRDVVRYIKRPDGTVIRERRRERIKESESSRSAKKDTKLDKTIIAVKPQWKAQVSVDFTGFKLKNNYTVGIEKRVLGPVFVGLWTSTRYNNYGVSISMEF